MESFASTYIEENSDFMVDTGLSEAEVPLPGTKVEKMKLDAESICNVFLIDLDPTLKHRDVTS